MSATGGRRPRPRVALVGTFSDADVERYRQAFPTVWLAEDVLKLEAQADAREVDLLVIGTGLEGVASWAMTHHSICFSSRPQWLPGPVEPTTIRAVRGATTEEYTLPDVPLPFSRCREADLQHAGCVRGWPLIQLRTPTPRAVARAQKLFDGGAILADAHENLPFATVYTRHKRGLGIAWLPCPVSDQVSWVLAIALQWAAADPDAFGRFGDWAARAEWMTPEERSLATRIDELEREKKETVARINDEISRLGAQLAELSLRVNNGRRRLLTAQGDALVDEVASVLDGWGFAVKHMDSQVKPGQPKREDLRLQDPGAPGIWEAIVEVRGYGRSGGKTSDLGRLHTFASRYQREEGRVPDQLIYVVNGELELPPYARQEPLASAREDVEAFGEGGGSVVWSVDLFRAGQLGGADRLRDLRNSLKLARGRWKPPQ